MRDTKFVFIHIQKSAGTAFNTQLRPTNFVVKYKGANYMFFYPSWEKAMRTRMIKKLKMNHHKFTVAKISFNYQHVLFLKKEFGWNLITWIRDPIDRLISNYNHSVHRPTVQIEKPGIKRNALIRVRKMDIVEYSKFMSNYNTLFTGNNPKVFDFIGVVEKHDESIKTFNKQFKYRLAKGFKENVNVYKPRVKVSQDLREELKQDHLEDYKFYNKVIKRYK